MMHRPNTPASNTLTGQMGCNDQYIDFRPCRCSLYGDPYSTYNAVAVKHESFDEEYAPFSQVVLLK